MILWAADDIYVLWVTLPALDFIEAWKIYQQGKQGIFWILRQNKDIDLSRLDEASRILLTKIEYMQVDINKHTNLQESNE